MKSLILAFSILLSTTGFAQQTQIEPINITAKPRSNELGISMSTQSLNGDYSFSVAGVQYKHWMTDNLGWRAMIGYAGYQSANAKPTVYAYTPDTIFSKETSDRINMPIISLGLEAQRHFYKRIYMYAALDVQAAYGQGSSDTVITKQYFVPAENRLAYDYASRRSTTHDVNLFYLGLIPSVGAKLNFNKLSVGLEISPLQCTYRTQGRSFVPSASVIDMSLGSFTQRCIITYCF